MKNETSKYKDILAQFIRDLDRMLRSPRHAGLAPSSRSIGGERTALINQLRAVLLERGITLGEE
jgi:hypothetical protein